MQLNLVGGFLGSGKTTAIIQASKILMSRGLLVGVVTNDQGKYLVDTAFMRLSKVPTVEVTGGCFCCNYTDLDSSLEQLVESARPDVIFAESVGSCADLVATVLKPLKKLKQATLSPSSFSVFADGRLLRRRLRDEPMPFSEDVVYIFDKQIEEAGLVVVNKMDLLTEGAVQEIQDQLKHRYPGKKVITQTSLTSAGVDLWLSLLEKGSGLLPNESLDIDYARYGHGEAQLAWLDEVVYLKGVGTGTALKQLISRMVTGLRQRKAGIGHLKFLIQAGDTEFKLSFATLEENGWEDRYPAFETEEARVMVNARVEMPAEDLRELFHSGLAEGSLEYSENGVSFFHPKQPNPTHRYS
jgi:Ni2+-binding GTPase involved in maturation of urease and hydrogenase